MGSPLGLILADFFLENGHSKIVVGKLEFYCRYMNDIYSYEKQYRSSIPAKNI